jgi:hypothetical protein
MANKPTKPKVLKLVSSPKATKKKPTKKKSQDSVFIELSGDIPGRYTFAIAHSNHYNGKRELVIRNVKSYQLPDVDGFLMLEVDERETIVYPVDCLFSFRYKRNK